MDWQRIDTVLLDMDGTVLDLHFDVRFWSEHLPARYAESRGIGAAEARSELAPLFEQHGGRLNWYCTDFWSRQTALDVMALKQELAGLIAPLPGALGFLDSLAAAGLPATIVTNAHPDVIALKMARTGLMGRFERVVSAHTLGYAKEQTPFWPALAEHLGLNAERCLFVDDSPAVIAAAVAYGIGQVVALTEPDSQGQPRVHEHRPAVPTLAALVVP